MTRQSRSSNRATLRHAPTAGAALVSTVLASMSLAAHAQSAAAPAAAAASQAETQVVTVTATRRREPARDVPVQVNALSAESLEQSGASSLSDYVAALPGVDVKSANGPGLGQVSIRGVTTGDQTIATVGIYVDDVAFGSSSAFAAGSTMALDMSLLDLNHIEVLRGPQGTLYGAGAMGGLLKYVTNEPDTTELSGKATLGVSAIKSGGVSNVQSGVINVPIKDGVAAMRVALFHEHQGGYVDAVDAVGPAGGKNIDRGDTSGGRLSLLIEPTSKLHVRLTALEQTIDQRGSSVVDYDIATGKPTEGDLERQLDVREPYLVNVGMVSADIEYDMGWARINSVTSAQQEKSRNRLDASFYDPVLSTPGAAITDTRLDSQPGMRKHTQEFRLTSAPGTLEWLGGLYFDSEVGRNSQQLAGTLETDDSQVEAVALSQPSTYKELAAYADVTWNLAKDWSLTGGARVARNRQVYATIVTGAAPVGGSSAETSKTYLGTLRYALTPTSNVYLRAASGYRPGGPNPPALDGQGNVDPTAPKSFKSDSLWSYEAGYKADLLDKRLSIEAALYDIEWKGIQQPLAVDATTLVVNAGRARISGGELFTRYHVTPAWTLDGSLSVIDAKLTEDAPALGPSGSRLPNSARFSGTIGTTGNFALAEKPAYAGASLRYVGERNAGFDSATSSQPNFKMPAYTLVDLQSGVSLGRVDLGLYVRNLFDKRAILGADAALVAFGSPLHATVAQPRTIGATVSASF